MSSTETGTSTTSSGTTPSPRSKLVIFSNVTRRMALSLRTRSMLSCKLALRLSSNCLRIAANSSCSFALIGIVVFIAVCQSMSPRAISANDFCDLLPGELSTLNVRHPHGKDKDGPYPAANSSSRVLFFWRHCHEGRLCCRDSSSNTGEMICFCGYVILAHWLVFALRSWKKWKHSQLRCRSWKLRPSQPPSTFPKLEVATTRCICCPAMQVEVAHRLVLRTHQIFQEPQTDCMLLAKRKDIKSSIGRS